MENKTSRRRVRVRVGLIPADLLPVILELTSININGELVKVIPINLVVRDALTRGLSSMLKEKRANDLAQQSIQIVESTTPLS